MNDTTVVRSRPVAAPHRQASAALVLGAVGAYEARCRYCYTPGESRQERLSI